MGGICGIQFINLCIVFILISIYNENFLNAFGVLKGPYKEINAKWYIEFGTIIVNTMIIEIPFHFAFPIMTLWFWRILQWYDRSFDFKDRKKSRKVIQQDYENMYVGAEFALDARLAQIAAVIWATFIYSPVLPLLLPLCFVNLSNIYIMDKWFVLRFYRTPLNYDEIVIERLIHLLKWTFPFHFFGGLLFLSNN